MRVAMIGLSLMICIAGGGASEAADTRQGTTVLVANRGATVAPGVGAQLRMAELSPNAMPHSRAYENGGGNVPGNLMGFLPAHTTPLLPRSAASSFGDARQVPYHPAQIPLPTTRTLEDHLLTGFVALMLIAYQLRRKHRFLRPHRFGI